MHGVCPSLNPALWTVHPFTQSLWNILWLPASSSFQVLSISIWPCLLVTIVLISLFLKSFFLFMMKKEVGHLAKKFLINTLFIWLCNRKIKFHKLMFMMVSWILVESCTDLPLSRVICCFWLFSMRVCCNSSVGFYTNPYILWIYRRWIIRSAFIFTVYLLNSQTWVPTGSHFEHHLHELLT